VGRLRATPKLAGRVCRPCITVLGPDGVEGGCSNSRPSTLCKFPRYCIDPASAHYEAPVRAIQTGARHRILQLPIDWIAAHQPMARLRR